ncbi:hypothetical protein R1flu_026411 [Riccia fluitans]|uniref:Uncharacterized protein n=1 Tax=Riccia fluitans TaxID=41844 RepID=A0ABD1XFV7_9MARC
MEHRKVYMYLGAPIGSGLTHDQLISYCLDRMVSRLNLWSNRILSFEGRVILIKHILLSIPVFYLSTIGVTKKVAESIETIARHFLWGRNEDGKYKRGLIPWPALKRGKRFGGLGLKDVRRQNVALFSKHMANFMACTSSAQWHKLLNAFIDGQRAKRSKNIIRGGYLSQELLLLKQPMYPGKSFMAKSLIAAWTLTTKDLNWSPEKALIPDHLTLRDLAALTMRKDNLTNQTLKEIMADLRAVGVMTVSLLWLKRDCLLTSIRHRLGSKTINFALDKCILNWWDEENQDENNFALKTVLELISHIPEGKYSDTGESTSNTSLDPQASVPLPPMHSPPAGCSLISPARKDSLWAASASEETVPTCDSAQCSGRVARNAPSSDAIPPETCSSGSRWISAAAIKHIGISFPSQEVMRETGDTELASLDNLPADLPKQKTFRGPEGPLSTLVPPYRTKKHFGESHPTPFAIRPAGPSLNEQVAGREASDARLCTSANATLIENRTALQRPLNDDSGPASQGNLTDTQRHTTEADLSGQNINFSRKTEHDGGEIQLNTFNHFCPPANSPNFANSPTTARLETGEFGSAKRDPLPTSPFTHTQPAASTHDFIHKIGMQNGVNRFTSFVRLPVLSPSNIATLGVTLLVGNLPITDCTPAAPSDTGALGYEAAEDPFCSRKLPHDAIPKIGNDRSLAHPSSPAYTPRRIFTNWEEGVHTSDSTLAIRSNAGGTRSSPLSNLPASSPLFALNTEHETGEICSIDSASSSYPPRANSTKATAPYLGPGSTRDAQPFTGDSRPTIFANFSACPPTNEQKIERVIRVPQMGIRRDAGGILEIATTRFTHANSTRTEAMFLPPNRTTEARPNAEIHPLPSSTTSAIDPFTNEQGIEQWTSQSRSYPLTISHAAAISLHTYTANGPSRSREIRSVTSGSSLSRPMKTNKTKASESNSFSTFTQGEEEISRST